MPKFITIIAGPRDETTAPGTRKACFVRGKYFSTIAEAGATTFPYFKSATAIKHTKQEPDFRFVSRQEYDANQSK